MMLPQQVGKHGTAWNNDCHCQQRQLFTIIRNVSLICILFSVLTVCWVRSRETSVQPMTIVYVYTWHCRRRCFYAPEFPASASAWKLPRFLNHRPAYAYATATVK